MKNTLFQTLLLYVVQYLEQPNGFLIFSLCHYFSPLIS